MTLCPEWEEFVPFRDWALANGYSEDLTIERIDNNGPYSPSNCRWATRYEQDRNKRTNVWIEYDGERICQSDLARKLGIHYSTIYKGLKTGRFKRWEDKK